MSETPTQVSIELVHRMLGARDVEIALLHERIAVLQRELERARAREQAPGEPHAGARCRPT